MERNIKAVIFDFGYTIYDSDKEELIPNAVETLEKLHSKGFKLAVISRTQDPEKRKKQIRELGINKYFDFIEAVPIDGTKEFAPIIDKFGFKPEEFLVVGDRVDSEIKQGNIAGMHTCHFLYGPRQDLTPQDENEKPEYTISNLKEVLDLV